MQYEKMQQRHRTSRIVTFVALLLLTTVVLIVLGSTTARSFLVDAKYQLTTWVNRIEERLHIYPTERAADTTYARSIPVLLYHGIGNDGGMYTLTKSAFRDQMIALKKAGFQTIDVDSFVLFMQGKKKLPQKSFLLTFDDGRKDSYYEADPILEQLGFHAIMFTTAGHSLDDSVSHSSYYLHKEEITKMHASGRWDIGSHAIQENGGLIPIDSQGTTGYFLSNRVWIASLGRLETVDEYTARIEHELTQSKKEIQKLTGEETVLFSYPFSDYGQESVNAPTIAPEIIRSIVAKQYPYSFRQLHGANRGFVGNDPSDNPYLLKRIELTNDFKTDRLITILNGATMLPLTSATYEGIALTELANRIRPVWGDTPRAATDTITIETSHDAPSSFFLLDGTRSWNSYTVATTLETMPRGDVALYARVSEPNTTGVRCLWSPDSQSISIEEMTTKNTAARHTFSSTINPADKATLGIAVTGTLAGCYENGTLVAVTRLTTSAPYGGVGIELWSAGDAPVTTAISAITTATGALRERDWYTFHQLEVRSLVQEVAPHILSAKLLTDQTPLPRYATGNLITTQTGFKSDTFGAIAATFATTPTPSFTTTISSASSGATAGWYWPTVAVTGGQEYFVREHVQSTTPSELMAKFTTAQGSISWLTLKEFTAVQNDKEYTTSVQVPVGATTMQIFHQAHTTGALTVTTPELYQLKDGSFDTGMVTLSFDDGRKTFIDTAFPILETYHYPATLAIITSHTGFKNYMSPADLKRALLAGNEIAAHTRNHVHLTDEVTYTDALMQIIGSWYDLTQAGFKPTTFVYPYGNSSSTAVNLVAKRFIGARSVERGFNTRNTDPYRLKDQLVEQTTTKADMVAWVTKAAQTKSWLILELHNVHTEKDPSDSEGITTAQLKTLLDTIQSTGLKVVTLNDGLSILRSR